MSRQAQCPTEPLVVVLGSTGTGKSDLAVELALRFNGEVINADAMQMYKGLPVTTNKITTEEQRGVPHHLLGTIGLEEETWSVGDFKQEATRIIRDIRSRGKLPIVAGGSQYYTDGLLFENSLVSEPARSEPSADKGRDSQDGGQGPYPILDGPVEDMLAMLRQVDPVMADRWHPKDRRKIRRSLEIYLTTGRRASDIYDEQKKNKTGRAAAGAAAEAEATDADSAGSASWQSLLLWVYAKPDVLDERLDARIGTMLPRGLLAETAEMRDVLQACAARGETVDRTRGIWQSIGLKEMEPYLATLQEHQDGEGGEGGEGGEVGEGDVEAIKATCLDSMKFATRRYARYQLRWIRRKTIRRLAEEHALDHLFLLDSTDKERWHENVAQMGVQLTATFLGQAAAPDAVLPIPVDVSDTARDVLTAVLAASEAATSSEADSKPFRQTCDVCQTTFLSEGEWKRHLGGHRHRRALKSQRRRALVSLRKESEQAEQASLVAEDSELAVDSSLEQ